MEQRGKTVLTRRRLCVLGATGSIGRQALDVIGALADSFELVALSGWSNAELLLDQCARFKPSKVAVSDRLPPAVISQFEDAVPEVLLGTKGLCEIAETDCDVVLVAVSGIAGLKPAMRAASAGRTIALANKESIVCGGELLKRTAERAKATIIPVDSEHSAVFQCLKSGKNSEVERIILTASGGPFLGLKAEQLHGVSAEEALKHPTWAMGRKISIDSATMMNKGLEVVEAHRLFEMAFDRIDVLVHPQSVVHSIVEFVDGSMIAHMGAADMRIPIQYALTYPERVERVGSRLDLTGMRQLCFAAANKGDYPMLDLAYETGPRGELACTAMSSSNEIAVEAFLAGSIGFTEIMDIVAGVVYRAPEGCARDLKDIIEVDAWARALTTAFILQAQKVD